MHAAFNDSIASGRCLHKLAWCWMGLRQSDYCLVAVAPEGLAYPMKPRLALVLHIACLRGE